MAHITLTGTLLTPAGKTAYRDQIRFTHKSTTGETVRSSVDLLTIIASGLYYVELEYGLVLIEYKSANDSQFKNLGVATVNGTNPSTSIPELLNGLVPVSSAELIQFQAILADAVTAKNESVIARNEAEAFAASIDLINDLSQAYIFDSIEAMGSSVIIFPASKVLKINNFYNDVLGGGGSFYYDSAKSKTLHNGGTVISPESIVAWDGTQPDIATLLNWTGTGSGCYVRSNDLPTLYMELRPEFFGSTGLDSGYSALSVQKALDTVSAVGRGSVIIDGDYYLEKPITITDTSPNQRKGWIKLTGAGTIYRSNVAFTGDRLINIRVKRDGEDYVQLEGFTIEGGFEQNVNGIDWFDDDIAYDLLAQSHDIADTSYDKGVIVNDIKIEGCYRAVRHSGNNTRFVSCTFRRNIVGEFRTASSNDVTFTGCAFRDNIVGSHICTPTNLQTPVGGTYTGCIYESNAGVGIFNQGGGGQTWLGTFFESNGYNIPNALTRYPSFIDPNAQCHVFQVHVGGFADGTKIIGGFSQNVAVNLSTITTLVSDHVRGMAFDLYSGTVILTDQWVRGAKFNCNLLKNDGQSTNAVGESYEFNNDRYTMTYTGVKQESAPIRTRQIQEYRGFKSGSSASRVSILKIDVPNENCTFAVEIEVFASSPTSRATQHVVMQKKVFFVNRAVGVNTVIEDMVGLSYLERGALGELVDDTSDPSPVLDRISGLPTETQELNLAAVVSSSLAAGASGFIVTIKNNGHLNTIGAGSGNYTVKNITLTSTY